MTLRIPAGQPPPFPRMVLITMEGHGCERCGHEWVPRVKTRDPKVCPKCKSPYWNTPRKRRAEGT